jgi:hypothetical protein
MYFLKFQKTYSGYFLPSDADAGRPWNYYLLNIFDNFLPLLDKLFDNFFDNILLTFSTTFLTTFLTNVRQLFDNFLTTFLTSFGHFFLTQCDTITHL